MFSFLSYDFFQNALLAGILIAPLCAFLGNFLVLQKVSLSSDVLSHTALAGVGLGIFLEISPSLTASIVAVLGAIVLAFVTHFFKNATDAVSVVLLSGGLSVALLFSHLSKNTAFSLENFLFGNILTVTPRDLIFLAVLVVLVCGTLFFHRFGFLRSALDEDFSESFDSFFFVRKVIFFVLVGVSVAVSLKIVGGLLFGALLVLPSLSASLHCKSFFQNIFLSLGFAFLSIILGIFASFFWDVPSSSAIVLVSIAFFVMSFFVKKIFTYNFCSSLLK